MRLNVFALIATVFFLSSCGMDMVDEASKRLSDRKESAFESEDNNQWVSSDEESDDDGLVNYKDLKELFPRRVAGLPKEDVDGETVKMMGFGVSTASAIYEDEKQEIEVSIVDFAGVGLLLGGMAEWADMEIDREGDEGYSKTFTYQGHKAFENYDARREDGEVTVIVSDRFIVTAKGENVEPRDLKKAIEAIDLDDLTSLIN